MDFKYIGALYIRLSKEDESKGESQSVTNQRSILTDYAEKHQIYVLKEYVDDGFSGTNFDRPAFNEMIKDIEAGLINTVITKDMSRLGRDYIQTGHYMEKYFPENKVRYISVLDGIDTIDENGLNDITPFKAILNDMYAKDISKKIKSVKQDKQLKGQFIGAKAPYGYRKHPENKNQLIIDKESAEIVKYIFALAYEGRSCRNIAQYLNDENIISPVLYAGINAEHRGPLYGKWTAERIAFMLRNQVYIGNMVQGRVKKLNYKSKKSIKLPENDWVIVENTHEAIIDRNIFSEVQKYIDQRKTTRSRTYSHPLKGKVYCKECGCRLGLIKRVLKEEEAFYFICRTYQRFTKMKLCTSHNIQLKYVERTLFSHIKNLIVQEFKDNKYEIFVQEYIDKCVSEYSQRRKTETIEEELNKTLIQIDRLYNDRLEGVIDKADFLRLYQNLKEKENRLKNEIVENESGKEKTCIDGIHLLEEFIQRLNKNEFFINKVFQRIELDKNKQIFVNYAFKVPCFSAKIE